MLAERWVDQLKPRAMVYLDLGFWDRSACRGARKPQAILKPCYWQAPGGPSAMLVVPPPGRVEAFASWGVMPGGMIAAGEDNWSYFLISRPVSIGYQVLARTGLVPGFGHDFSAIGVNTAAIRRGVLDHLVRLGTQARVPLLIIDPYDAYSDMFAALPPEQKTDIRRVGRDVWLRAVVGPMSKLPPELATVPHDGHFGPGANALIAALIAERLQELGVALGRPTKH
jgi:hypothetical protein